MLDPLISSSQVCDVVGITSRVLAYHLHRLPQLKPKGKRSGRMAWTKAEARAVHSWVHDGVMPPPRSVAVN